MSAHGDGLVRAILGPTNTGKTYLAIERMCAHSSGVIGFPLRLLAREVYDRVVQLKGASQVALITGEERIVPQGARYYLCTAESMPVQGDGGGRSRIRPRFRLCRNRRSAARHRSRTRPCVHRPYAACRGREETLILGSDTLKPLIRELLPEAEIVSRPRFSTLRYSGAAKLSRLPPRSAVVAFSAEQVYALAEMLRRFKGGAAVVMGALSPATRNSQVAMFQRGEVDYLVATDAIGMGLNMDVTHVAFAGLEKFDGRRDRRLTIAEMAQIAGRAGRHQRDGTFGTLGLGGDSAPELSEEEVNAIEEHRFRPLDHLYWRSAELDYSSVADLIASLEVKSDDPAIEARPAGDRPGGVEADRRGPGDRGYPRGKGAQAVGRVRPSGLSQGRTNAPCANGAPPVQLCWRGRPYSARMVRRGGGAAGQCRRRYRSAGRSSRRNPELGLHRPAIGLAGRPHQMGRAHPRSRSSPQRCAP
jgi:ATP-dependent RNA helicase SUPV3L1/SUV3